MKHAIKNLALRGGGILGTAYAGALQVLEEVGVLAGVERVAGTSAGAITAMLLSLGYTPAEITEVLKNTDFGDFTDKNKYGKLLGAAQDARELLHDFGINSGDPVLEWLRERVKQKGLKPNATFADFKAAGCRDLFVFSANINTMARVELSNRKTPNVPVIEGVRASMAIPMFFKAWKFSNNDPDGDIHVDGGMVYNYPMSLFDEEEFMPQDVNANEEDDHLVNPETLGFYLFTPEEKKKVGDVDYGAKHFGNFVKQSFMTILQGQIINFHASPGQKERTILMSDEGFSPVDFDMPMENINQLVQNGIDAARAYFSERDML